jgi:hypothetical protein
MAHYGAVVTRKIFSPALKKVGIVIVRNVMSKDFEKKFKNQDRQSLISSGFEFDSSKRSASFLQEDGQVVLSQSLNDAVDILDIDQALERYPEFKDYYGRLFDQNNKQYPRDTQGGYFIRVKKGKTVEIPIQACLFLKKKGFRQRVHNLIIVEEGARVYLITGCASSKAGGEKFHLGVSEFYVKKGGYLNFTMIHSWDENIEVKPMSIAHVEQGGEFISNYICLKPVKEVVMYPTAVLAGEQARASFSSLILSHPGTLQDIGSRVIFNAPQTQAEIISRTVSLGGRIIARGHLNSKIDDIKGHLECRGLIINEKGYIHAIPELETNRRDVDLSHEAAIGRVSKEEIEYLCSRGLTSEQAQSIIIRGFMDVGILGLPKILDEEITKLEQKTLDSDL